MKTLILILSALAGIQATSHAPSTPPDSANNLETPGGSNLITSWMDVHFFAVRHLKEMGQQNRQLAYMGVALYESIVAGDPNYRSLSGQLNDYPSTPPPPENKAICWQASANAALAAVMRYFYGDNPMTVQRVDSMEKACTKKFVQDGYSIDAIETGYGYGKQVAGSVISWCKSDLADKINDPYIVPEGEGLFEPVPPAMRPPIQPYMGNCRTMVKGSTDNTLPPPPMAFSREKNSPFYNMVNEVYRISKEKDPSKVATALFWDDFPNNQTLTAGGHWESILKAVMTDRNMSLIEGAGIYAELFITMQDAAIGCFKAKYTYNLLRPVTYIRKYMGQAEWQPLITTPAHPEYPAAHATVSMSAATILTHLLGDKVAFTDNSYAYRGYPEHHFSNFVQAGTEAGMSRLYGGIHYQPSIEAGFQEGSKIAGNIAHLLAFKK